MSEAKYDYGIIGAGAAGLQLALAFAEDPYFTEKKILIVEKEDKNQNDKTWCFWEAGKGKWDDIIDHKWEVGIFAHEEEVIDLDLKPYAYKKLKSLRFYEHARSILSKKDNIEWLKEEVQDVRLVNEGIEIRGNENTYEVEHCFDSRIHPDFNKKNNKDIYILQHFKGWEIEFEEAIFDPEVFTMMDFRLRHGDSTSFCYVLPTSEKKAIVEFTLFTASLIEDQQYESYLKQYIEKYISKDSYQINEVEYGVIPMTTYPFHKLNNNFLTKIGTAGSWVRPSTGYSFRYTGKYVNKILQNIKNRRSPNHRLIDAKPRWHDTILLDIIFNRNELGPDIFYQMYKGNPIQQIFKFLDGETSMKEDISIMLSFKFQPFLVALLNYSKKLLKNNQQPTTNN